MIFDALFDRLPSDGWLSRPEADLLWRYACRSPGPFVEVGAYCGRASVLLASVAQERQTRLYCVDPWADGFNTEMGGDEMFRRWQANTAGLPVVAYRMRVEEWNPIPAGLTYLDGDHSREGTIRQLAKGLDCRPQYVFVHDVNDHGDGRVIKEVCLEALGPWTERVERLAVWEMYQ